MNNYTKFGAMIATSTIIMLGLMYLNTYQLDHVFFSQTRGWMALVMGATMAIIMLLFMLGMYLTDKRIPVSSPAVSRFLLSRSGSFAARQLWRTFLDEGHDSAPFDRNPDQ